MHTFIQQITLAAPLFSLILVGYVLMHFSRWPASVSDALTKFVFAVSLPAMMFRLLSNFSDLPPVDTRLLIAFFGSCLMVFALGRYIAWRFFKLDGVAQSIFAISGVFSNNGMLGLPLAKIVLGDAAIPSVALILVFNALILWTLLTASIEWARYGKLSMKTLWQVIVSVFKNPLIIAIFSGTLCGLINLRLPAAIDVPLSMLAQTTVPLSLIALGMGLSEYGTRKGWRINASICTLKLVVQPVLVWALARLLNLPPMETKAIVLLGSMACGANVYVMSRRFNTLEGPVAGALVMSTVLASVTTPLALTLIM